MEIDLASLLALPPFCRYNKGIAVFESPVISAIYCSISRRPDILWRGLYNNASHRNNTPFTFFLIII
jgi:hypothetical protein